MIKVGFLVSYDYSLFLISVKQLYNDVDKIFVAIDKERKTWSGNKFVIPNSFFDEVKQFDTQNKIEFYFDAFYVEDLSPIECDTRERNMLLKRMGNGWLIQLDIDEYVYDFKKITNYLRRNWYLTVFPKLTPIVFRARWITLFKKLSDGYLYVENNESFPFITNMQHYEVCRSNGSIRNHNLNFKVIHQSWARSEDEIYFKINNWGHCDDFDTQRYFEFWKSLNSTNYKECKNIHPLSPEVWNELHFLQSSSIDEFIEKYKLNNKQVLIPIDNKKIIKAAIKKLICRE